MKARTNLFFVAVFVVCSLWGIAGAVDVNDQIAHWRFDEGSGSTAYDSVGSNDGTVYGAIWTTGQIGGGLDFDADDGVYIEGSSGAGSNLNIYSSDLTISCWVKTRGTGGAIVARTKPWYHAYVLGVATHRVFIDTYKVGPGHWTLGTDEILNEDTWYHIVGVFDRAGDMGRLYVSGTEEANGIMATDPVSNDAATKIGCRHDTSDFPFNGVIDDVRIYDRALSAEEIKQLWEQGLGLHVGLDVKPGSCPNPLNLASRGVLPVAILGSEDFDVTTIDIAPIRLAGVPPVRSSYEDVAAPVPDGNDCECTTEGPDGYTDLTLKFKSQKIVEQLINGEAELTDGQGLALTLTGMLSDGTPIQGTDCIVVVGRVPRPLAAKRADINGDGIVNILDFSMIAKYWLESCVVEY